jgi:cytochrome c5
MSEHHHEEAHTGPIKTPKQLLLAVAYSFILPVFIIIGLVYYVTSDNKPQAGSTNAPESVAARIQKVGSVEIKSANAEPRSGEEVFKGQCGGCHAAGTLGSPKFGDAAAWGPRVGKGYATLLTSALKGKGNMAAQAGGEYSDFEIGRAVVYMANGSGGKLAEPKKPDAK